MDTAKTDKQTNQKRGLRLALMFVALFTAGKVSLAAEPEAKPQAYAVVIAGDSGEVSFAETYLDWAKRFHKILTVDCGIPAANVRVLMEKKDLAPFVNELGSRSRVLATLQELNGKIKRGDQLTVLLMGHATLQNKIGKLCLPGPDLTQSDLAMVLKECAAREVIFIDTTASCASFLDSMSAPGRVVLSATNSPGEGNEAYFMEFFLEAFENKLVSDQSMDDVVSVLEAFNYAASNCPKWYYRQYFDGDKSGVGKWRVEGKHSRALWQKFYGRIPEKVMGDPKNPAAEDAEPALGGWGDQWAGRRMPTEHAQLDDNGDRTGTAVYVNEQFLPLSGDDEEKDGALAKRTILGKPRGDFDAPSAPLDPKATDDQ